MKSIITLDGKYMVEPAPDSKSGACQWVDDPLKATVYRTSILADKRISQYWPRAEGYMRSRGLKSIPLPPKEA